MSYAYTLYKARGMSVKRPVCAICVDRTRGQTQKLELGYGVEVWLCTAHASTEFLRKRNGRDFVLTLTRLWQAHGCLTRARHKALDAHLNRLRSRPQRPRPGSYAWPKLRQHAERLFAAGIATRRVITKLQTTTLGHANPTSTRTIHRWKHQQRWRLQPP
jgi:hypothetical protein